MSRPKEFFNIANFTAPYLVQVFTSLRQSACHINTLGYPELLCVVDNNDDTMVGDTASKLTMALSIHLDYFLGLTCSEASAEAQKATLCARFAQHVTSEEIMHDIDVKAADIIDTLMSINN